MFTGNRERCRALARQLREMANQAPSAFERKKVLRLDISFEYRARYLGRYTD